MVLSSVLVMLIATVFVVQTDFYETQLQRTAAQDNARAVTEFVSSELRTAMAGSMVVANDTQLVVRAPLALAVVCDVQGSRVHVHFEGGEAGLDTDAVSGLGVYNDTTDTWSYYSTTWKYIDNSANDSDERCADEGTDTTGISDEFNRLRRIQNLHGSTPPRGTLLMFFKEWEFLLTTSALDSTTVGLFVGTYGDDLTEYASGMDTTAQFLYRTGGTTYSSPITGGGLANIDAVRIVAHTRVRAPSGGRDDVTAGWTVDVPLRNVN